jgi:sugar phosphate isomerase/epimerase
VRIGLSSSSVFPEGTPAAFEHAAALGFDGVEIMVGIDAASQDLNALLALRDHYAVPILAVHAPCLLITQRVWGTDPWGKLQRAREVAEALEAATVVVHPPFRWQREYARGFLAGIERMTQETPVQFAVENMYPWRAGGQRVAAYSPGWDVRDEDYPHTTLDLSHTAVARVDPVQMALDLGDRLVHLHLADGTGSARDEHLVPGRGNQPVEAVLQTLGQRGFGGSVVVEVSTRTAPTRDARIADLRSCLEIARRGLRTGVE